MNLMRGELRNHLNPTALRVLKKRLAAGKITPQVFKDILKQQMVKYFFQTYRHPLMKSCENYLGLSKKRLEGHRTTLLQPKKDSFEIYNHKRF
jgi:hypothetical protein